MTLKQFWSILRGRQTNFRYLNASWTYYPNGDPMTHQTPVYMQNSFAYEARDSLSEDTSMSRMSEMSHAMHDFCNENYGPEDIPGHDAVYEEVMAMSEEELVADLAERGETLESNAIKMHAIFQKAKAEADMRLAIKAWLKCPEEKRPSPAALGQRIAEIAAGVIKVDNFDASPQS